MSADLIVLTQFTTGRALWALQRIRALLEVQARPALVADIDITIGKATAAREINRQWLTQLSQPTARGKAVEYDYDIDRAIAGLDGQCGSYVSGLGSDDPVAMLASAFRTRWIPGGVAAITHLSFEDELEVVEEILAGTTGEGEDAEKAKELGLTPYLNRLLVLVPKFKAELEQSPASGLTFDKVRAVRAELQTELRYTVADLVSTFKREPATLARVLQPIRDQEERLRALRQGRRKAVADVEPDTGREVSAPAEAEG